jgi:hypothetical protein
MGKLTDSEKIRLIDDYRNGNDLNELSLKYKIHRTSVRGLLKRRGEILKNFSESRRIYTINENFFDELNENSSYVLGFLYADGYHNEKRKSIRLSLKETDEEILVKIKNVIGSNRPLGIDTSRGENFKQKYLDINNVTISTRLKILGCVQNKTFKITFPNFIPDNMIKHFIRGYFDGDGGLSIYTNTNKNNGKQVKKQKLTFRGTENFCTELKKYLSNQLSVGGHISENKIFCLEYSGKQEIIKILDYLYGGSTIFLERKKNKYKNLKNEQ